MFGKGWKLTLGESLTVCFLSPEFIPISGGVGAYTVELLSHLPENINVHLITMQRRILSTREKKWHAKGNNFKKNLNVHYIGSRSDNFMFYFNFQQACLKVLPRLHRQFQFDLIHTQFPVMPDILIRLLRRIRVPTVCTVHSTVETQLESIKRAQMGFLELDRAEKANVALFLPLKLCQYFYLRKIRWFITVSDFIRKKLVKSYRYLNEKKIRTIHIGVNTQRFSPTAKRNLYHCPLRAATGPIVLFTGRFVSKKGPHILIQAIPKVLKHVPDAYFVFAGAGDFTPYIKLLKQENVPVNSFLCLGYVDSADIPKLYNLSSVYVAPSFEDSLGIRILEAMSCGKAVVASQVGGVPEIISSGQNGIVVPPGESGKLAEEIVNLLEDRNLRRKLAEAGRETVLNKFSSEMMARQTATLYKDILNG